MIEKYKSSGEYDCSSTPEAWTHNCYMLVNFVEGLKLKINELVDAVNALVYEYDKDSDWYDGNRIADSSKKVDLTELAKKAEKECRFNPIQADREVYNALTSAKNVQDKFAEQRRWIGCLVEYGNADDGFRYGILTNIEPRYSAYPFEIDNGRDATADCWLPSKTIFYKGGDNE